MNCPEIAAYNSSQVSGKIRSVKLFQGKNSIEQNVTRKETKLDIKSFEIKCCTIHVY